MSSPLEKLPAELLCNILNRLDRVTLANFAHCSRQCHPVGIAILYETIKLRFLPVANDVGQCEAMISLLQKHPQVAKNVKTVSVRLTSDTPDSVISRVMQLCGRHAATRLAWKTITKELEAELDTEHLSQFLEVADSTTALFRDQGYLDMLLALCPALQVLDLEAGMSKELYRVRRRTGNSATRRALNGSSLQSIFIAGNFNGAMPLDLLQLQNLKSLYIHKIRLPDAFDYGRWATVPNPTDSMGLPGGLPGLSHLELRKCQISLDKLCGLILAPKALETFIFEAEENTFDYLIGQIHRIRETVRRHRTLKQLWLDHSEQGVNYNQPISWIVEDFSMMAGLRRLRIDSTIITRGDYFTTYHGLFSNFHDPAPRRPYSGSPQDMLDVSISQAEYPPLPPKRYIHFGVAFPRSIEEIYLTKCSDKANLMCDFLHELFQYKEDRFPGLRKVTIELNRIALYKLAKHEGVVLQGIGIMEMKVLIALAEAANIEFVMVNDSPTDRISHDMLERKWGMDEDVVMAECSNGSFRGFEKEILNIDDFNEHDYDENGEKKRKIGPMGKETCEKEKEV